MIPTSVVFISWTVVFSGQYSRPLLYRVNLFIWINIWYFLLEKLVFFIENPLFIWNTTLELTLKSFTQIFLCIRGDVGAFDYRSKCHWFESIYNFSDKRNGSPRIHLAKEWIGTMRGRCLCKFDILRRRIMDAHKTGSIIVSPGRPER